MKMMPLSLITEIDKRLAAIDGKHAGAFEALDACCVEWTNMRYLANTVIAGEATGPLVERTRQKALDVVAELIGLYEHLSR